MAVQSLILGYRGVKLAQEARNFGRATIDVYALTRTPTTTALQRAGGSVVEVVGLDNLVGRLVRHGVRLAYRVRTIDAGAMDDMLLLMRQRVPRDTGRLFNGITGEIVDGIATVTASAVRTSQSGKESPDYAFFVEHGTKAGRRGTATEVADANYFALDVDSGATRRRRPTRRTRKVYRDHPGTKSQPFFYNSAREVLADRVQALDEAVDGSARDVDLT